MAVKKAAIMVDEMYQVLEVWFPYYRLKEAGLEVGSLTIVSKKPAWRLISLPPR